MKFIYGKNSVYSTKLVKYTYNKNYSRYVLLKNSRNEGFEDYNKQVSILSSEDEGESERCSISRTKRNIREIALCNDFDFFYTQTINKSVCDRYNLKEIQALIRKKFKAYQRKNKDFKYLIIYEHHKDGAYHLHGLVKGVNKEDIYTNNNNYLSNKFFNEIRL